MKLNNLEIRALHRLDAANSRLRHSVVEACFYNLRVLAQELPGRRGNGEFTKNLTEALGNVASARELIDAHFAYKVTPACTIAEIFPLEHETMLHALEGVELHALAGAPSREDQEACQEFADSVVRNVDLILDVTEQMRERTLSERVAVGELVDELVSIQRVACEAEGVCLERGETSERNVAVFANRADLLNALVELARNAMRHGFKNVTADDKRITVSVTSDQDTRDTIIAITDNGQGMSEDRLRAVGTAGASTSGGGDGIALARRVVEGDHLGLVTFESETGKGTTARVWLPRRVEPELEADMKQPKPKRRASTRRKLAAAAVLLAMVAIGIAVAWYYYAMRGPMYLVVTPDGRHGYARISDAVAAAGRGARIVVTPGEYTDHVVLEKPVTIEGNGKEVPVLRGTRDCAIISRARGAVVKNLNIALDVEIDKATVFVESGNLRLDSSSVTSKGLACVEVAGGNPIVIDCVIGHGRGSGVFVRGEGKGLFEKNEIRDCERSGIVVSNGANPTCRDNTVQRCKQGGIKVYNNGRGLFERNEVSECGLAGVVTKAGGAPIVNACKLHDNQADGVLILEKGKGIFEYNEIWGNLGNGIVIHATGAPVIRNNQVKGNASHGILTNLGAKGIIQDNQSEGNGKGDEINID